MSRRASIWAAPTWTAPELGASEGPARFAIETADRTCSTGAAAGAANGRRRARVAQMSKSADRASEAADPDVAGARGAVGDPDADVARLAQAGDSNAAIRLLMQRHGDAVYRFVRNALRDDARADDVHQRIFIEAYRDLRRFSGRSSLRTWLFAIARYRVIDALKARAREEGRVGEGDGAEAPDPRASPGEQLDDARLREALARCLDKLGEHVRSAVLLRYQQGFSFEEMAEIMREKPGTLQARVARALPILRACIAATTGGAV